MTAPDLVIAYNFPPFADASAVTVAKRIVHDAHTVDVICQDLSGTRRADQSLSDLVAPLIRRRHVLSAPRGFLGWSSIGGFTSAGLRRINHGPRLGSYRRLYSRSMWPHSHVLAAAAKIAHGGASWTAEFSDPLLRHVDGSPRRSPALTRDALTRWLIARLPIRYQRWVAARADVLHLVQALPFAHASELVFTNSQQREVMLADLEDAKLATDVAARSTILPQPAPPPSWLPPHPGLPADRPRVHIGYYGTLYPNRGLGTLVEAVRQLRPCERRSLRIVVHSEQGHRLANWLRTTGTAATIELAPALSYLAFLDQARSNDYLLAIDTQGGNFATANPFLPSKLSDYQTIGRPVIALTYPGSEMDKRDMSIKARVGDVVSVGNALRAVIAERTGPGAVN